MLKRLFVLVLIAVFVIPAFGQETKKQKSLRVYFVGNSVTDTIKYPALAELAKSRGYEQVWGRHMIPGAPLQWIWQHPKDGFQEKPFGHYPTALADFEWDVLSLQPFDRHLEGKDGDLTMAKNFIDLALPKSPDLQVYVYARWPRQGKDDFDTAWLKKYTGGWDGTNETKDYFERLTLELRKAYPKLKIHMVPVGHVMHELNQQMKAGQVPGHKDIKEVFADGIHLNNVGSYIVGCTYFATLYRENPKGLSGEPYKVTDKKLAEVIQEAAWKVVSTHELAGVAKPKAAQAKAFMKGWRLHIWLQDNEAYYSLLPGTNWVQPEKEVVKSAVKGFDAIKPRLDQLRQDQEVFLCGKSFDSQPPKDQVAPVLEYGKKIGLKVQGQGAIPSQE